MDQTHTVAPDHFCLKWNNYQSNMVSELDSLRSDEDLVDVTLSCEGQFLKAHKVILSACSSYFRNVFKDNPCKHPVVILNNVSFEDVEALLTFVYQGVVYVAEKKLATFLETAELLQIKGLTGASSNFKEGTLEEASMLQDKVPPPPQLLATNFCNTWKQQGSTSCSSSKSSPNNSSSPPPTKRKKSSPNKIPIKENLDSIEVNSPECSETDSDMTAVKAEITDNEYPNDEIPREDTSRDNSSFYDTVESDENEDDNLENKGKSGSGSEKMGLNSTSSQILNMIANYNASQQSTDQSSASESKWKCMLPQECMICHKIFSNAGNLRQHITNVHTPGQPVQCDLCSKSFKNKEYLRKHKVIIHKAPIRKQKGMHLYPSNGMIYNLQNYMQAFQPRN